MKRLNNFTMVFDGVMLNILIAFFLFYIFCPMIIFGENVQGDTIPYESLYLAGALAILLIKYLHENATTSERFEEIYKWMTDYRHGYSWQMFLLYSTKLLVPLVVSLCILFCLWLPQKSYLLIRWFADFSDKEQIFCLFSITISYFISFSVPDIVHNNFVNEYKNSGTSKGPKRLYLENLLSKTCKKWLGISIGFMACTFVGLLFCYLRDDIVTPIFCKLALCVLIAGQTGIDYCINHEFYFKVGHE